MKVPIKHKHKDQAIHKFHILILSMLALIGFLLRIYNLENYSFWNDEIITIIASKGVLTSGVPVMPDGSIYFKSPLHVYSVATMIDIFGISEFSTRIVSVIFGSLTIILIYIVSKKFSENNKIIGISAALIYTFSIWSIAWSREARFYQQFQFFALLTIYIFWLGYIRDTPEHLSESNQKLDYFRKNKYLVLSIFCFILAMLSSKLAIILIPPLVLTIIIKKGFKGLIIPKYSITMALMVGIWVFYQAIPIIFPFETKNPLLETDIIGFELVSVYRNLVGFGFFLLANFILTIFIIIGIFIKKWRKLESFWYLYTYLFISSIILIFMIASPIFRSRYYYFLFPIMIILVCMSIHYLSGIVFEFFHKRFSNSIVINSGINNIRSPNNPKSSYHRINNSWLIFMILIAVILLTNSNIFYYQNLTTQNHSATQSTLGLGDVPLHPDYKGSCKYIRNNYLPGDCILVKMARPVEFYLIDYLGNDDLNHIEDYIILEYFDMNLSEIDSVFTNYRVWVLVDDLESSLIPRFISKTEFDFIRKYTEIKFESKDEYTIVRLEK